MLATTAQPSLTQIEELDTTHLTDLADRFAHEASLIEDSFIMAHKQLLAARWEGQAGDAALRHTDTARVTAQTHAESLRNASEVARRGGADLRAAQQKLLSMVTDARRDGFAVTDDLTVSAYIPGRPTADAMMLQPHANELAADIRAQATALLAIDRDIATALDAATAEFHGNHGEMTAQPAGFMEGSFPGYKDGPLLQPPLSPSRKAAVDYAERWADDHNPDYKTYGQDCTNFASQVLRAGGLQDQGDGWDDWHHGDPDDWYYDRDTWNPKNTESTTWDNAAANHDFMTQSGRGHTAATVSTQTVGQLDPLAPSKAGLLPGDLIYYRDTEGKIDHVAVYVGQAHAPDGSLMDVVDQHSGADNYRKSWIPVDPAFIGGPAQAEFVHVTYPGE